MSDHKKPIDQAVELVVFAPLGFALEARRLLPTFVERGRQQVQMARFVGKFAVQQGQTEATKRLGKVQQQAEAVLGELGLAGEPRRSEPPATAAAPPPPGAGTAAAEAPTSVVDPPAPASVEAATLPISDYDSLSAFQVMPRLEALDPADLDAVRLYEESTRGRRTILNKIAQLS